jgi:hypothetical protein
METKLDDLINEYGFEIIYEEIHKRCRKLIRDAISFTVEVSNNESITTNTIVQIKKDESKKEYPIKTGEQIKKERYDHRAAVDKKRAEIEAQGIEPESLLTKENLEKWIGAGMSYQRIARELTGCHEADVSRYAKRFGLKSIIAGIIAGKYNR